MKLQRVNECNQTLTYSLGVCASLSTIKFLKLLRFNCNIALVGATLRRCLAELVSFSLVFFTIWFALVQLMYLMFGDKLAGFASLMSTMSTAFAMMLGKISGDQMLEANSMLGPLILAIFYLTVVLFSLNIFISIIVEAFEIVRDEAKHKQNEYNLMRYLRQWWFKLWTRTKSPMISDYLLSPSKYKDHINILPERLEGIIEYMKRVGSFR